MQKHVTDYTKVLSSQTYNKQCVKDIFSIFNKFDRMVTATATIN